MKIINKNPNINLSSYGGKIGNKIGQKSKTDTKSIANNGKMTTEDKVVISPQAKQLKETNAALKSVPEIREEKITRIREQIENGTYEIDTKKIAENIIADILETRSVK